MTTYEIMSYATDEGTVSWAPETEPRPAEFPVDISLRETAGFLFGPVHLRDEVREILSDGGPVTVTLGHGHEYTFTDGRDTLTDLAAAMVAIGHGRGLGTDSLWKVLGTFSEEEEDRPLSYTDEDGLVWLDPEGFSQPIY